MAVAPAVVTAAIFCLRDIKYPLALSPMLAMTCFILDREHIVRIKNNEYHRFVIFGHYQQRQL
ncbi:hypothetical protein LOS07_11775, partial [Proteus mirabilis]|uniref:hypothetical protein n=1 Tax=Proteus mirabilis TaxID=584 RepID=UPI001E5B3853